MLSLLLQKLNNPPLTLRNDERKAFCAFIQKYVKRGSKVYDIGCGDKPFMPAVIEQEANYTGVDIVDGFYDSSHIDLIGSAYDVPIESGTADIVMSSQVIEHLEFPEKAVREMARILKKDGYAIVAFPFLYPLHAQPRDYMRYSEFFMHSCFDRNGLELVEMQRIGGFWYCAGMMTGLYLQSFDTGLLKKTYLVKIFAFLAKWFLFLIHALEGLALEASKRNVSDFRALWTVNYVMAARKR